MERAHFIILWNVTGRSLSEQVWGSCINLRLVDVTHTKREIPMTDYHCEGLEHGLFHLGVPNTTCAGGQIIANKVIFC